VVDNNHDAHNYLLLVVLRLLNEIKGWPQRMMFYCNS